MINVFTIFTRITTYFVYYNGSLIKNNVSCIKLVFAKKQRFGKHIDGRNKTNKYWKSNLYFYKNIIDLKDFNAKLSKIEKKSYKNIDIYYIEHIEIKKIDDYESAYSVNPLYWRIDHAKGYTEEKKWK